jgi:hypothetical protein
MSVYYLQAANIDNNVNEYEKIQLTVKVIVFLCHVLHIEKL